MANEKKIEVRNLAPEKPQGRMQSILDEVNSQLQEYLNALKTASTLKTGSSLKHSS